MNFWIKIICKIIQIDEEEERRRRSEEFIFALVDKTEYADFLAGDMTTLIKDGKQNKFRKAVKNILNRMGGNTETTIVGSFLENLDLGFSDKKTPDEDDNTKEKEKSAVTDTITDTAANAGKKDLLEGITDNEFWSLSDAEKAVQLDKLRKNAHKDLKKLGNELHDMPKAGRNDKNPDYKALRENVRNGILLINAIDKRSEPEFSKLFNKKSASLSEILSDIIDYSIGAIPIDDIIRQNDLGTVIRSGLKMSLKPAANQADAAPGPSKKHEIVTDSRTTDGRGKAMSRK